MSTSLVWFRRDLRVHDHPALWHAVEGGDAVLALFVIDDVLLRGRWPARNRLWFMVRSVAALAAAIEERGGSMVVVRGRPDVVVPSVAAAVGARRVLASRDVTPYGCDRDRRVAAALAREGIAFEAGRGLLIAEPEQVRKADGDAYRVFGPFHRAWLAAERRPLLPAPDGIRPAGPPAGMDRSIDSVMGNVTPTAEPDLLLEPGEPAARRRLDRWAGSEALDAYDRDRDRLDMDGTSRLSQDLRWGLLSALEVEERVAGPGPARARYRSELAWRDFYAHLLFAHPRLARAADRSELEEVAWERDERLMDAWRDGRTGYPVVDAAMRQLHASGWMHNRARMIVASFLTKHLGVDWRIGERHFMEHLVDGDVASNNGGWQWAASTGTDSQPWVRIFNPTLQGRRFDPEGDYVRRWLPELADLPASQIHEPPPGSYVPPIVDHREARARALAAYGDRSSAKRSAGGADR